MIKPERLRLSSAAARSASTLPHIAARVTASSLTLAVEIILVVAVIVIVTVLAVHAEPIGCPVCPSHLGWLFVIGVLGAMAGGSITFVVAGLFAAGGRDGL
jgi:hypothetical protein